VKTRLIRGKKKAGKPARKRSAVKAKKPVNTGAVARHYMVRTWWILRGAAMGVVLLGVLYGGYLGVGQVISLESLSVRSITVEGCRRTSPDSIIRLSGVNKGEPLLRIDLDEIRTRVLRHPVVRDATVVRELPDTLRISVQERSPVAAVMEHDFSLVDTNGVVVERVPVYPDGYPLITGTAGGSGGSNQPGQPGRQVMDAFSALEVLEQLKSSGLVGADRISELMAGPDTVRVSLVGSGTVLVFSNRNVKAQVGRLVRLVEAGVFDARSAGYDLRFEGRVIGMAENQEHAGSGRTSSPAGGRADGQG
jgi:hypothetical protein